jgi:hypothetical protein
MPPGPRPAGGRRAEAQGASSTSGVGQAARPVSREWQVALRIALLSYRGAPHCGGQGVYVRNLSRELVAQGHHVEVLGGPPYPELDEGVALTRLDSLDLYREDRPLPDARTPGSSATDRRPRVRGMCTAAFPEPLTFSLRAKRELARDSTSSTSCTTTSAWGGGCSACSAWACPCWPRSTTRSPWTASWSWPRRRRPGGADAAPLVRVHPHAGAGGAAAAPPRDGLGAVGGTTSSRRSTCHVSSSRWCTTGWTSSASVPARTSPASPAAW